MRQRKVPIRTCLGCRSAKPKKDLIRVVRTPEGRVELDRRGKVSGRGAYICPDGNCLQKALAGKQLEKALQTTIAAEFKTDLERSLNEPEA